MAVGSRGCAGRGPGSARLPVDRAEGGCARRCWRRREVKDARCRGCWCRCGTVEERRRPEGLVGGRAQGGKRGEEYRAPGGCVPACEIKSDQVVVGGGGVFVRANLALAHRAWARREGKASPNQPQPVPTSPKPALHCLALPWLGLPAHLHTHEVAWDGSCVAVHCHCSRVVEPDLLQPPAHHLHALQDSGRQALPSSGSNRTRDISREAKKQKSQSLPILLLHTEC